VEDNGYLAGQAAPYRWDFTNGGVKMYAKNNSLIEKRANMDGVISYMSSDKNILNMNDSSLLYNAYFYINMLWVILATSLIYYIFTEL
jgi:hypothetical protein